MNITHIHAGFYINMNNANYLKIFSISLQFKGKNVIFEKLTTF